MPLYTTSSTAAALGVSQKWLDNLLSHNKIDGIQQSGQGVSRRLPIESVETISVAHTLIKETHVPAAHAVALAERLIASQTGGIELSPALSVTVDLAGLRQSLLE